MKARREYLLITDFHSINEHVTGLLNDGWELYGNPIIAEQNFAGMSGYVIGQALVRTVVDYGDDAETEAKADDRTEVQ